MRPRPTQRDASAPLPLAAQVTRLASQAAIYGSADVFTNTINFLLVPVYTRYLTPSDYGALALLLLFSTLAKVLFRLGLDGAFLRVHFDLKSQELRARLAGTLQLFSALVGGAFLLGVWLLRAPLTALVFSPPQPPSHWLMLVALDVYLGLFAYVPLGVLRAEGQAARFSALSALRHAVNTALKLTLVVSGFGVGGVLLSDVLATGLFALALLPTLGRAARPAFSAHLLRECLAFGLPKVPHGLLLQAQNLLDRRILDLYMNRAEVGLYQVGYTFGSAVKFAISAFEPAWQPFVYEQVGRPGGGPTLARVVTYAWGVFLASGLALAVLARPLVELMTPPTYWPAAHLVPVVTLAYLLHGAFLLLSIGISIAKQTRAYPAVTAVAAIVNVVANVILIPRLGTAGAAWATVLSYSATAVLGYAVARRAYPLPFEHGRLLHLTVVALVSWAAAALVADAATGLGAGVALAFVAIVALPALLLATGFLRSDEKTWLLEHAPVFRRNP